MQAVSERQPAAGVESDAEPGRGQQAAEDELEDEDEGDDHQPQVEHGAPTMGREHDKGRGGKQDVAQIG